MLYVIGVYGYSAIMMEITLQYAGMVIGQLGITVSGYDYQEIY